MHETRAGIIAEAEKPHGARRRLERTGVPKFDSKSGKFAIRSFLIPYFSMSYCPRASCFGEDRL